MANRFQISVPKRRADHDPWFRIGTLDVSTTVLIIGLNVIVMFLYAVSNTFFYRLAMTRSFVTGGEVWRLVTWPFVTIPDIWAAVGLAFFWFVGKQMEQLLGRVRFTKFLGTIAAVVLGLALLIDSPLAGMRLIVLAVFVTFVAENPRMPFFFGVPAWIIACVYVGLDIIRYAGDKQPKLIVLLLAAIGAALLLLRGYGWGSEVPWVPKLQVPALLGGPTTRRPVARTSAPRSAKTAKPERAPKAPKGRRTKPPKNGSDSTVVPGPWGERGTASAGTASTGSTASTATTSTRLTASGPVTAADVDRVLDKVAASGMASLTEDERAILENASKSLRDRSSE